MVYENLRVPEGYSFEYLSECASTNDRAFELGPGAIVCAGRQTAARGRMGRSFSAEEGGLYVSMCVKPSCEMKDAPALAALAALAAADAIGPKSEIKWPNDIQLAGKKVCGILSESREGVLVFGFGINVNNPLPEELTQAGHVDGEAQDILQRLIDRMSGIVAEYPGNREELLQQYALRCCTLGRMVDVTYRGMPLYGFACGIDKHGGLMVMTQENRTVVMIYSGEATFS